MNQQELRQNRFHGIDVIRIISFYAIATFHISLIHYHTPTIAIAEQSLIIKAADSFSRVFSFSGFTIVFISTFLIGYGRKTRSKILWLAGFLLVGWLVFSLLMNPLSGYIVWDIYPLLAFGILTAWALKKILPPYTLAIVGLLFLWVPFWKILQTVPLGGFAHILGGANCAREISEWPVFPWVGLVWFGLGAGQFVHATRSESSTNLHLRRGELGVWAVLGMASIPYLGSYYSIRLGSFFSCDAYRQEPVVFWAHMVWVIMWIRFSVDPRVNRWCTNRAFCRWVSNLACSRFFGAAYLLNFLLAYLLSWVVSASGVEQTEWNVPVIALISVGFLPFTEMVLRRLILVRELVVRSVFVKVSQHNQNDPDLSLLEDSK